MDYYAIEEAKRAARAAARQEIASLQQAEIEARKTPEERQESLVLNSISLFLFGLMFFAWKVTYGHQYQFIFALLIFLSFSVLLFFSSFTRRLLSVLVIGGCAFETYKAYQSASNLFFAVILVLALFIVYHVIVIASSDRFLLSFSNLNRRQREFDEYGFEIFRGDGL